MFSYFTFLFKVFLFTCTMYLMVGVWGSRERAKNKSGLFLFSSVVFSAFNLEVNSNHNSKR